MKVRAEFYSRLREVAGAGAVDVQLEDGATVRDLVEKLCRDYPRLRDFEKSILFGIGVEFVNRDHRLGDGDAVAIMPPVQGG
ncbi:MAG: MoaD/ThiS family protein [Chthoniobacterales bacterium]